MKVSPEEIAKIASLARILLTTKEVGRFQIEVGEIINYNISKLKKANKDISLRGSNSLGQTDEPRPSLPQDLVLSNAPNQTRGLFVVPKVLE